MWRPTLSELLSGFQRTIMTSLLPELTSPYALAQAMVLIGMVSAAGEWLAAMPAYDAAEVEDLVATVKALRRLAPRHLPRTGVLRKALTRASRAAAKHPPDRRELEGAISEFVAALALGELDDSVARVIRGYVKRHLDRSRALLSRNILA
jgi:hypothetical protein